MAHANLRRNARHERILVIRLIAGAVVALAMGAFALLVANHSPDTSFALPFMLILVAGAGMVVLEKTQRAAAGARGEAIALQTALKLPDDFMVFNNLLVPGRAGGRPRELDLVAVAPHAVFVVEVKHFKGEIEGPREAPQWRLRKVGRGGTVYYSTVSNPLRQVASASGALAAYLKSQGVRSWVQGVVCFTRSYPPPPLAPGANAVLVAAPETLCGLLENWKPPRGRHDVEAATAALRALTAPDWVAQAMQSRPDLR